MAAGVHFLDARGPGNMRIYAIGDVHGRLDLLSAMHARIRAEILSEAPADWRIIHLGDYIDRGPDSAGVISFLIDRMAEDKRVIALAGNHDIGLLEFLIRPDPHGLFARNGGIATARSYGVEIDLASPDPDRIVDGARRLARALPQEHDTFLRTLPRSVAFGDFFYCHAGIRPGIPLDQQDPDDLIWIREDFLHYPGLHPKVVVHGHTPQDTAEIMPNRVNVDTLAHASGRLTALVVDGVGKRLLQASEEPA